MPWLQRQTHNQSRSTLSCAIITTRQYYGSREPPLNNSYVVIESITRPGELLRSITRPNGLLRSITRYELFGGGSRLPYNTSTGVRSLSGKRENPVDLLYTVSFRLRVYEIAKCYENEQNTGICLLAFALGVTVSDGWLGSPRPARFLALTRNSYSLPFSRPLAANQQSKIRRNF